MADYADSTEQSPDKLELAHARWKLVCDTGTEQREREREDLSFLVPENQWTAAAKAERMGAEGVAPRPVLSISKLDQPLRLVKNQMRAAKLGVNIHPISEDADDDTAETLQGLYRHIERESRADLARSWAFARAVTAGRGVYRILKEYDPYGGHPTDQRIVLKRVLHQESVFFDPTSEEPDYSDGKFLFYVAWVNRKEFKRKYPDAENDPDTPEQWQALNQEAPEWVRGDDVLVAEYWYREAHSRPVKVRGKKVGEQEYFTVHRCVLTGSEILEESDWDGQYLPWVLVYGDEILPFDQERRYVGMVGPSKDGQRLFNVAASTLVERMLLEPKAPFVGYAKSFEPYKEWWINANRKNYPYLPVSEGPGPEPWPLPQRAQIDQSGTSLAAMVLQQADSFIQSTTTIYDPSLGRESPRDKSGKAIMALQQQADAGTSNFLQNLADAMTHEARIVLDLIPHVYDRPGRVTRILHGDDDKSEAVMLGKPYLTRNGRPMPVGKGTQGAKLYDLKRGVYDVSIKIGKSFQTRLEQGSEFMSQLLTAMPEYLPLIGDLVFKFQDAPGADEIAKRLAKVREQKFPGLGEGEDGQMSPEQAQAQVAGMKQQMQMMQMQLQAAIQEIQTEQAKQQATMAKAKMDNEAKVMVEHIKQQGQAKEDALKMALERMEQTFEERQAALQRSLELLIHREEMAHEAAMAAGGGQSVKYSRNSSQEQGREGEQSSEQGGERGRETSSEMGNEQEVTGE